MNSTEQELFRLDVQTLLAFHKCSEMMEHVASTVAPEAFVSVIDRQAKDANGPHWFGWRCRLHESGSANSLYIHFGIIFLPSTRIGLMVELDQNNNADCYRTVWEHVAEADAYDVVKAEPEYLKLFMPEQKLAAMMAPAETGEQAALMRDYFTACGQALLQAAKGAAR